MNNFPTDSQEFVRLEHAGSVRITTPRYSPKNAQDAPPRHTREQWLKKIERHGLCCHYCNLILTMQMVTKDHLTPLCRGGSDKVNNLVPACMNCNQSKSWRTEREFAVERERLSTGGAKTGGKSKSNPFRSQGEITFAHTIFLSPPPYPMCRPLEEEDEPGLTKQLIRERDGNGASWSWRNPA